MARRPPQAGTAFGPMVIVAVERLRPESQRIVDDELAGCLPPCRHAPVRRRLPVGALSDLLVRMADSRAAGIWAEMLCRKRYGEDQVRAALDAGVDRPRARPSAGGPRYRKGRRSARSTSSTRSWGPRCGGRLRSAPPDHVRLGGGDQC